MLLTFTTGNYCCFKEPQSLSLLADGRHLPHDARVVQARGCRALRVVGVFGDTATGKSHLGKALRFMQHAVLEGWQDAALHCPPFWAEGHTAAAPSFFEVLLVHDDVRYRYGFTLQEQQVAAEWLYERKGRRELRLFSRRGQALLVHASFAEGRRLIGITPPDLLLLTIAARLQFEFVAPVVAFFRGFHFTDAAAPHPFNAAWEAQVAIPAPVMSLRRLYNELGMEYTVGAMQSLVQVRAAARRKEGSPPATDLTAICEDARQELLTAGTRSLLAITPAILKVLNEGGTLFLDDLDAHLSFAVLQGLLGVFQHPELNPLNAQLVFTTHLPDWLRQGKWLNGQRYMLEKPHAAASLSYWSMPARERV